MIAKEQQQQQQVNGHQGTSRSETEVVLKPKRRSYKREYKLHILAEAERCQRGELGALLRREGLYYSTLRLWRQQQAAGKLDGRGPQRQAEARAQAKENRRLQRENARLHKQLAKAEAIIEVQKKLSALLGVMSTDEPSQSK